MAINTNRSQDPFYVFNRSKIWSHFVCWIHKSFIVTSYKLLWCSIKKLIKMGPKRHFWVLFWSQTPFWVLYGSQDPFYVFYGSIIWSNFNCWVYKLFIDTSYKVLRYSIKKLIRMGPNAISGSFMGLKCLFWVLYGYQDPFCVFYGSIIWSNFNYWVHKLFIDTSYKLLQ